MLAAGRTAACGEGRNATDGMCTASGGDSGGDGGGGSGGSGSDAPGAAQWRGGVLSNAALLLLRAVAAEGG